MKRQRYVFTIRIAGDGRTPEEAWADAVACFAEDPGGYDNDDFTVERESEDQTG